MRAAACAFVLGCVVFTTHASAAVVITSPAAASTVRETFALTVQVSPEGASIATVVAKIAGKGVTLTPGGTSYVGTIQLDGVPRGAHTLTIVATDSALNTQTGSITSSWTALRR